MRELVRLSNAVDVQALADALRERGIAFRVDNAGMHALLPLPDVMDMRVFVAEEDFSAARRIVEDLGPTDEKVTEGSGAVENGEGGGHA